MATSTSVTMLKGRARLQIRFAANLLLLSAPILFAFWFFWGWFQVHVKILNLNPDVQLFGAKSAERAWQYYEWVWWEYVILVPFASLVSVGIWLAVVIRGRSKFERAKVAAGCLLFAAYLSTVIFWFFAAILLRNFSDALAAASQFHAEIAANAGVLPYKDSKLDWGISRTVSVIDVKEVKGRYERLIFLYRTIESESTSPALARHFVSTLMQILKAVEEGSLPPGWSDREFELRADSVNAIGRLAGRDFPMPQESGIGSTESQKNTRRALLEWWATVDNQPEWEPIPLYQLNEKDAFGM